MISTRRASGRGTVQSVGEQYVGMLDEAHLDAPAGWRARHCVGEIQNLGVAFAVARAVADQQQWWLNLFSMRLLAAPGENGA